MLSTARLLRLALRQAAPASATLQLRGLHASTAAPARRNRRSSPSSSSSKRAATFQGDEDDDEEFTKWFEEMQKQYPSNAQPQQEEELPETMELVDDGEDEHDDGEDPDEETEKFLDEAEELFRLSPSEFQKRMDTFDQRHAHEIDEDDEEADDIDRATERIPKTKLLKVLGELNPNNVPTGKNAERMPNPGLKTKNSAPLEKKPKQPKAERVTYRQESVGIAVLEFVQNLLVEDADVSGADIIPTIVEANVSPDLRRVVLFWEPVRLNSENQKIGKKKIEAVKNRLQRQERWIRRSVTQHLNLKYSPVVQFKQQEEAKAEEARSLFEEEMKWLDRV
ncbi:Ribosome-binding factor A [Phytophthora cinnamomi]|uniref:Ribosome-binding factor A n=1 Tax=Phytophthora cinnamomi TaxID=4785 RepID=UPI00355A8396|nr:Ribosome-binding factor A [Phytophthora cinnamomi]